MKEIVTEAVAAVADGLQALTPWDFERVVLNSSAIEGAWEVDTLLRLTGIVERRERRRNVQSRRTELDQAVGEIRRLPPPLIEPQPAATKTVRDLRRAELYLDGPEVNSVRLPLEVGDVFERDDGGSLYLLLAPACDLVLRSDGRRTLASVPLVPVKSQPTSEGAAAKREKATFYPEMPYFAEGDGADRHLDLLRPVMVDLDVLDLATYRVDGRCLFDPAGVTSDGLFAPQAERRVEVAARSQKSRRRWRPLTPCPVATRNRQGRPQAVDPDRRSRILARGRSDDRLAHWGQPRFSVEAPEPTP